MVQIAARVIAFIFGAEMVRSRDMNLARGVRAVLPETGNLSFTFYCLRRTLPGLIHLALSENLRRAELASHESRRY
jgi:hypothetical protein